MQPNQQLYRVLGIISGFIFVWNILIIIGCLMASAWSHTPKLFWYVIAIWIIITIVSVLFKKMIEPVNYKRGSLILFIVVIAGLLPTSLFLVMPKITQSYIPAWEAVHCTKYDHDIELNINATCDNGDSIYIYPDSNDIRRLFKGGVQNSHYPYNLFY